MTAPDYVVTSGREELPIDERLALLEQAILSIQRGQPAYKPGAPYATNGAVIHATNELIGEIRNYAGIASRKIRWSARILADLSGTECRVLACNRGGYTELDSVKARQRTREAAIARGYLLGKLLGAGQVKP